MSVAKSLVFSYYDHAGNCVIRAIGQKAEEKAMNSIETINRADATSLSNVALVTLRVALSQQANFSETLERIVERDEVDSVEQEGSADSKHESENAKSRNVADSPKEGSDQSDASRGGSVNIRV